MSNKTISLSEILAKFVSDSQDCRDHLKRPFIIGEYIYASNGHIAVRIPKQEGIEAAIHDKVPQIEQLFTDNIQCKFLKALVTLPSPIDCNFCGGSGTVYKCPACDGEGDFDHHDYNYACKTCDETGDVDVGKQTDKRDCFQCDGTGHKPQRVKVGKTGFDSRYLSIIFALPGVQFAPHPDDNTKTGYFKFDGGEGLIMPRRK
jgi:hypothetical protein